ncbi:hypothetical protein D3C72_1995000 [compost metagenome]
MIHQFDGNRGTVRDDGGAQVARQLARQLHGGRAAIEKYHLSRLYHGARRAADGGLGFR